MNESIQEDLDFIKNEIESLNSKIDLILDTLNSFTIMLADLDDDDDELEDTYGTEDSWSNDKNNKWNSYEDEDDEWSDNEDES